MIALGVSLLFTACKKDEDEDATVPASTLGTATISGRALAKLDLSNDTSNSAGNRLDNGCCQDSTRWENVPAGTTLYATIDTDDLILNGGGNGANRIYTTTVDGAGNYTFTVDANVQNVEVKITSDDFTFAQVQFTKRKNTIEQNYELDEEEVDITKGQKQTQILYFDNDQLID